MLAKTQRSLVPRGTRDPFAMLRQITADFDRMFDDGPWFPRIDVFERENALVTRVDLPGMRKEDVSVEIIDGQLTLSGERKRETEEQKDRLYRTEREYGGFYRTVLLPEGVALDKIKATFANGVLEVSVPLAVAPVADVRKVPIDEPPVVAGKTAA